MNFNLKILKFLFAVALILATSIISIGQYRFTNYDYTHGLQISSINMIAEDSLGYLWLGSLNGLVKFDGLNFQNFESKANDSTTIYGSEIADIEVDKDGMIWTSFHEGGISVYDHKTQRFRSRSYEKNDGIDFPKYAIVRICADPELNKLWVVSQTEGVYVIDMKTLHSKQVIKSNAYREIQFDPADPNYIYISGNSVKKIDKKTYEQIDISDKWVRRHIIKDNIIYGHDWASKSFEINLTTKLERVFPTSGNINRGLLIHQNEMWVGCFAGIQTRNLETQSIGIIKVDPDNPYSIANHHITSLFKDSKDRIWIGTQGGLSAIIPEHQNLIKFEPSGIDRITDILPSSKKNQFYTCSFYDDHLAEIDIKSQSSTTIHSNKLNGLEGPLTAKTIGDDIWVMFFNGLGYFSEKNKKIKKYNGGRFEKLLLHRDVGDIAVDDSNNIWLCKSRKNYLFRISANDPSDIDTVHFPKLKRGQELKNLHWDGYALWLGTDIGVCRYDPKTAKKQWIQTDGLASEVFTNKIEDISSNDDHLWVLSLKRGALKCTYDRENEELKVIKAYYKEDGLPNNRPWNIDFDSNGNIYMGSEAGLSIYNPDSDRFLHLNKQYGFTEISLSAKILDDKLFLLSRGLSYFDIENLPLSEIPPSVKIQSLNIADKKIIPNESNSIKLNHKENNITIDYLAIELSKGRDISYRYRVHEEDDWSMVDYSQRKAIFNELPSGDYTFEIEAANKNMIWGPKASISFEIKPPFWKTWWFRLLIIASIGFLIYLLFRYRLGQVKHLEQLNTRMAELENEALRAQMNPHFIFNSLNSIKSFIITNRKEEAADYLTIFSDLIRIVLNNSKKRFISLTEEIEALSLYAEIENIRLEDKFSVSWNISDNIDMNSIIIPPLTIQPFVENAIWHGFVHKESKGQLNISIEKNDQTLIIKVKDDGVGREKSKEIEKKHPRKRSFGIDITEQRLDFGKTASEVIINDLYDSNNQPKGTEVILKMPLILVNSQESPSI